MRKRAKDLKSPVNSGFPTLAEVERFHVEAVVNIARTKGQAAEMLGISLKGFYDKLRRYGIEWSISRRLPPEIQEKETLKEYIVRQRSIQAERPEPKDDGRDVSFSVDPEERDYYYNCDFPWGVKKTEVTHALGRGEDYE